VAEAAQEGGGLVAAPAGPAVEQLGGLAGVVEGAPAVAQGEQAPQPQEDHQIREVQEGERR